MVAFNLWKLSHISMYPELVELFVIPIGVAARDWKVNKKGIRYSAAAKRLKDAGVVSGPSDYFLPVARGGHFGYFRELKALDGSPTAEQLDFIERMLRQGYKADWCRGWEALKDGFLEYLRLPPTMRGIPGEADGKERGQNARQENPPNYIRGVGRSP